MRIRATIDPGTAKTDSRRAKRASRRWLWMAVALMLAGSWPCMAQDGAPPARVVTAVVTQQAVAEQTRILGTLFFDRVSHISTEVSGLVSGVHVRAGDRVKKGQRLFDLNTDFIDNDIASARAELARVAVRLQRADKELERYKTLFSKEAVSEREYDDVLLTHEELLRQQALLNVRMERALIRKRSSVIRAPFDGIILEKLAETGEWVAPGTRLCDAGALAELMVSVPVSEEIIRYVRSGERVTVTIEALDRTVTGTIDGLLPVADPQTRSISVKVRLPKLETPVLNMSALVEMPMSEKKDRLMVPRDALVNFQGQDMIYTINQDAAAPLPVTILGYAGGLMAVTAPGLSPGMPVVVDGNDRLRPGQPVTVIHTAE